MINLNEDCLIELFKWLPLPALILMADTCERFREIARVVFKRSRFSTNDLFNDKNATIYQIHGLLMNFGDLITEITIGNGTNQTFLRLIIEKCSDTMKSLVFNKGAFQNINRLLVFHVPSNFSNLKKLIVAEDDTQQLIKAGSLFSKCKNVVELTVYNDYCLELFYPNLRVLNVVLSTGEQDSTAIGNFCGRHTNLERLNWQAHYWWEWLTTIVNENVKQLDLFRLKASVQVFELHYLTDSLKGLCDLQNLKELVLLGTDHTVSVLIKALSCKNTLEVLGLDCIAIDNDLINGLKSFKNLQALRLQGSLLVSDSSNENLLMENLCNLSQLSQLVLINKFNITTAGLIRLVAALDKLSFIKLYQTELVFDGETYDQLVKVCRGRKNNVKLTIYNTQEDQGVVAKSLDEKHKKHVEIVCVNERRAHYLFTNLSF